MVQLWWLLGPFEPRTSNSDVEGSSSLLFHTSTGARTREQVACFKVRIRGATHCAGLGLHSQHNHEGPLLFFVLCAASADALGLSSSSRADRWLNQLPRARLVTRENGPRPWCPHPVCGKATAHAFSAYAYSLGLHYMPLDTVCRGA